MIPAAKKNLTRQGYKNAQQQADDVLKLKAAFRKIAADDGKKIDKKGQSELTKTMAVGQSAAKAQAEFEKRLNAVANKVSAKAKGLNESDAKKQGGRRWDVDVSEGPIKGAGRIYVKCCIYGALAGADTLVIDKCRDILRGTIVFTGMDALSKWASEGNNIVDLINDKFDGQVLRVKNRFIGEKRPPRMKNDSSNDSLEEILKQLRHHGELDPGSRDFFYRDIQMLVMMKMPHTAPLDHQIAEIQVTVQQMLDVKHHGGHKLYKAIRSVTAYSDVVTAYKSASDDLKPLLEELKGYTKPTDEERKNFHSNVNNMVGMYRDAMKQKEAPASVKNIIDTSQWFKSGAEKG